MNEATFFSFRQPSDWYNGTGHQLHIDDSGLRIKQEQNYRQVKRSSIAMPHEHEQIVDIMLASDGRWYMLDRKGFIWRTEMMHSSVELVMSLQMLEHYKPIKLAVNKDQITVLYSGERGSLLQSYLNDQAQLKWQADKWYDDLFTAYDLLIDQECGVIVVGALSSTTHTQLLRFDAIGQPIINIEIPKRYIPQDEEPLLQSISEIHYQLVHGEHDNIVIVDFAGERVLYWKLSSNQVTLLLAPLPYENLIAICFDEAAGYWALAANSEDEKGSQLISFTLTGQIVKQGHLELATGTHIEATKRYIYIWNEDKKEVYSIAPIAETAYWTEQAGHIGMWCSQSLDSGVQGTHWHKIKLQVQTQKDTQWNISFYASDEQEILINNESVHLDQYIRNDRIDSQQKLANLAPLWTVPIKDAEEALLHQAVGRYLWIFIEMIGSSHHSPLIESMEVYFPRSSYLTYLPSIYQKEQSSQQFLSRYLSIFQSMVDDTDQRIAAVSRSLEPNQVTGSSLRWLLGWLGIEGEDYWTEEQLRELLKVAPKLYSMRGTRYAIETLVRIYTGHMPIILEFEQIKPLKENIELGQVAERLYATDPHAFNVLVKSEFVDTELKRVTLQHILDAYKPVFATCKLVILQSWVYMDVHSYLGMNTVLSEPALMKLDGQSSMPHHTITIDVGQDNRIDKHTRLGLNSRLE